MDPEFVVLMVNIIPTYIWNTQEDATNEDKSPYLNPCVHIIVDVLFFHQLQV
jgi:hypothetical protein